MPTTEQHTTTVLLVDDHPLMRRGLRTLLESEANIAVAGEAGDGQEAIDQVKTLAPDVTIMDISMPNINGIEATRRILAEAPETRIIALSIHAEKRFVDEMLRAGARAYLLKDSVPEELVGAIHSVMRGESFLSAPILGTVVSGQREPTNEAPEDNAAVKPILQTKLHRPSPPPDLVPRTRVLEQLEAGRVRPLTLVSAPAGYGKSILISSWLETCCDWPSAWISLDKDDSNLRQFLGYFVAAVQSAFPQACEQTRDLVSAPQLPPLPALVASLSNDLDAIDKPFTLVLDDYYRIDAESPVHDLLHQLLAHPPIPLHLIIISRRDPPLQLHTLRAQGQITEVRMQDLCFDRGESRILLEKIPGFTIGDDALTNLQHEIEGWVVGLRLVSLTLRKLENRDGFLRKLHGGSQQIQEYLANEVIAQQSPLMQDWLLRSAMLDRFCEPLIQAVCTAETRAGAAATDRGKFIESLLVGNLFVIPLDTGDEWFRYHHQFQQLLLHELNRRMAPDEIAGLHSRASAWYESRGLIDEAIQHALKAKDTAGAADIVERHQQVELKQDRWYIVERWLAMLPLETVQQRPSLLLARAWGLYHLFKILEIPPILEQVVPLLVDETADQTLLGEVNFFRGYVLMLTEGDAEGGLILFKAAREQLHNSQKESIMGDLDILTAIASQMVGAGASFIHDLEQRFHAIRSGKGMIAARLVVAQVWSHLLSADLLEAVRAARRCTNVCKRSGLSYVEAWSRYLGANAGLQSYHLDEALQGFQYVEEKQSIMHRKGVIEAQVGLVLTYQAMQRPEEAASALKRLMEYSLATEDPQHIAVAQSCQARLSLLQGDAKPAIDWAQSYQIETHVPSMLIWMEDPAVTWIRVMTATGSRENLQQASELLAMLRQSTEALNNTYQTIELLVLQSLTLEKLERVDEALQVLQQAIKLAQPGGWIRPFVELGRPMVELLSSFTEQKSSADYLRRVLDHCLTSAEQLVDSAVGKPQFILDSEGLILEPLTKREFEILELLAQRLQNKEIAALLCVSPETIKTHLKHLYQKLQVKNRREAAEKAVEILAAKEK